jgi:L-fucose isomerase-like protein
LTKNFAINPLDNDFKEDLRIFAGTCNIVKGFKNFNIGAIGARTTAFKTVRYDEIAMQNKHINIETNRPCERI